MSFERLPYKTPALMACLLALGCADASAPTLNVDAGFAGAGTGAAGSLPVAGGTPLDSAGTGPFDDQNSVQIGPDIGADASLGAAGSVADAGSMLDADSGTDAGLPHPRPPCLKDGKQVVLLGDSYINWVSHTFPADLFREAGKTYRNYAVGGYSMGSGGLGLIPPQLDQAVKENPDIITAVMTGGGNDVLVADTAKFPRGGDCKMSDMSPTIPDCQKIVDVALEAADKMLNNGIAHGVQHVVYFFYPNVPEGTIVGGTHPNAILEYAAPKVQEFCDSTFERTGGKATCYFVDLRPVFKGHPEYFAPTDIHPNTMGSAAMAKAVWQTMKDNCLAQPESSGCCEP